MNQLAVQEFLNTKFRKFTAITGVLDPAKWQVGRSAGNVVDEHHARVDPCRNAAATLYIAGLDGTTQAIR